MVHRGKGVNHKIPRKKLSTHSYILKMGPIGIINQLTPDHPDTVTNGKIILKKTYF